jgi:hypothetical protein
MTDRDIVNAHRQMLTAMRLNAFSGAVEHDTRKLLEGVAHRIDWTVQVCWTCGESLQHMANLILATYPQQ